jgi:hypothetical protein
VSGGTLVGLVLILVGTIDLLVGWWLVAPRAPERSRPVLRMAFAVGAVVMIALGTLFLTGILGSEDV